MEITRNSLKPPFNVEEVRMLGNIYSGGTYDLKDFDEIAKFLKRISDDEDVDEFILSCTSASYLEVEKLLAEMNAHYSGSQGKFERKEEVVGMEGLKSLAFYRGGQTFYMILEDIDYDLIWPFKKDVLPKDCILIENQTK